MAPVGRPISSGRNPFSKDEDSVQIIPRDEIKQEPPDDESYSKRVVEAIPIKLEEEESMSTYAAMNGEEGVVLKQEDCSDDEEGKLHMDIHDNNSIRSDRDDEGERVSNSNLIDSAPDSSNSLLCKVCGKQFFRMFYFNLHMKTHRSPTINRSISEKPHTCLECGKSFAFLQHLTGHSRMHIAGRYYECPVCRRKFVELSNLSMHLLKTHPDEKPYKCSVCEKQFTQSSALKKHLRIHSDNISPEELDRIDMMFFVNVANGVDVDEPLKKKIKLEVEEGTTYRNIDKSSIKEKIAQPKSKSPLFKEKSVRSPEKEKFNQSSEGREGTFESFQSDENCRDLLDSKNEKFHVPPQSLPATLVLPPPAEDVQPPAQQVESKESSIRDQSAMRESLPDEFSVVSDNTSPHPSKLSSAKESSKVGHGKESISLKNGVPLEQVKCPQIKVVKFGKTSSDSEPLTVNGQSLNSPLKSISGGKQSNLEPVELLKETENSNQSFLYSGDKMQKGRPAAVISVSRTKSDLFVGWEKNESDFREPLPSLEKPDGEYEVKYKCHRCEIFLDSEEKLHDHLMDHTGVKLCECRFCGKDFTTMTSLKRHLYYHVVGWIPQDCTRCGKTFASFRDLKEHCMTKKCDASNSARYKCFRCRKQFPSLKKLKVHLLSQCKDEPTKYFFPKKSGLQNSPDTCENSTVNASKQNDTLKGDSDSSKTTCQDEWVSQKFEKVDSSDAGFEDLNCDPKDAEALKILSELAPEKGKECWHLQCQSCKHKFENAAKAKVHAEVGCGVNGVLTEANTGPEGGTHKVKVILEEDENLQCFLNCAECDMKISGVEKMLLHIQEHIYQQNNLICPVLKCEKLFKDPKEFKIHLKAHTGHKPFKCSDCGKRFFLRENYENHAQRHGILKHWNSFSTVFGEKASKSSIAARSPITIESSIINLEVSEADVERRAKSTQQQQIKGLDSIKEEENSKTRKKVKAVAGKPVVRPSQPFHRPLSLVAKSLTNGKQVLVNQSPPSPLKKPTPTASRPSSLLNRPSPPVGTVSPPISRQSPSVTKSSPSRQSPSVTKSSPPSRQSPSVTKSSPPSRTSSPASWYSPPPPVSRPPAVNRPPAVSRPPGVNQSYVHRLPQIVKSAPTVHRQILPLIKPPHSLDIPTSLVNRLPQSVGAPIVNRIIPGHQPAGSLSVTPQGIFTVTPPRTYLSPAASSSIKSNFSVPTSRPSLSPKDPNTRAHPPSYYEITENSRAIIQAANSELKKYPRSGRCEVCKKICSRLDKHMMVHLGHKPHMCPVCPQAFRQSEHLRRHIRARHEGNHRQFECPHCEKRLTRKDKLKEHMKNCVRMITGVSPVMSTVSVPRYIGNSLFDMIPGPAHLSSQPPLQGHTTA